MSAYPYPPWGGSDPAVLDQGKSGRGSWWKNTKDAIKKPWKWKAGSKDQKQQHPQSSQQDQWAWGERQFKAFPPIMAQLTPAVFQGERRSSYPDERLSTQLSGDRQEDAPEYDSQRRPRLDSIFPMYDTPSEAAAGGDKKRDTPAVAAVTRLAGGKEVGRSSSFNETDYRQREREREGNEEGGQPMTSGRRESVDSNNSGDRTIDRRKRRMGVVRQLPVLPKRSGGSFDRTDVHSLPEISSHRRRRPTPVPIYGRSGFKVPQYYGQPPRGTPMHNFPHPPWSPQADNLPTLSEESDNDGIKGFDEFKMY